MDIGGYEAEFLNFLKPAIARNKRTADRSMVQFIALRMLMIFASASLPALTTLPDRIWSTVAAIIVAVLAGLDTQFKWGEEWRHFRATQLSLERMLREFERRKSALTRGRTINGMSSQEENLEKLCADVEDLLQTEADGFFKFRITEWKSSE